MNPLTLAKKAVSLTAGLGASQIVAGIVANTTPQTTVYQKVTVRTSGLVLGFMLGDAIEHYLDRKQIEIEVWWHENITTKADSK